jgi:hypothetical protein
MSRPGSLQQREQASAVDGYDLFAFASAGSRTAQIRSTQDFRLLFFLEGHLGDDGKCGVRGATPHRFCTP